MIGVKRGRGLQGSVVRLDIQSWVVDHSSGREHLQMLIPRMGYQALARHRSNELSVRSRV